MVYVKKACMIFQNDTNYLLKNDRTMIFYIINTERDHFIQLSYSKYIIFICHDTSVMFVSTFTKLIKILTFSSYIDLDQLKAFKSRSFIYSFTANHYSTHIFGLNYLSRISTKQIFDIHDVLSIRSFFFNHAVHLILCSCIPKKIILSKKHYHYQILIYFPVSFCPVLSSLV